ncbi:hypothetical protein [Nocardioides sp. Soil805]|uniref:hypothetical protein n=1 Tax=Nocardioides sp. Soil805 TaxID=1736416 RepID=UPI000703529E|nr:hypothetical protein [Nocardioides sp. Soil805]KRF36371.1 hypothetical protein ASG94_02600 [Nocardioides sp. Soil805]
MTSRQRPGDPLAATEAWFLEHGLSYFVPAERAAAREALTRRRVLPALAVVAVVAAVLAGLLGWLSSQVAAAPAVLLTVAGVGAVGYALTALRARPIVGWALKRTLSSLGSVVSTASRALPLLLVFIAFLFINAEAWQMTSHLGFGTLWLTALLLLGLGTVFLLVRLPEEVDQADDAVDDAFLLRACRGTPLEGACREMVEDPSADPARHAEVTGYERWNLIVVLLVIQAVQVVVLVAAVFGFLLVFGSLIVNEDVQQLWTGEGTSHLAFLTNVSAELVKVSLFLASFSGLYFTVSAITDETYRGQFFSAVMVHLERAVGVRAVYLALRERRTQDAP